jgi:hypothetical protein
MKTRHAGWLLFAVTAAIIGVAQFAAREVHACYDHYTVYLGACSGGSTCTENRSTEVVDSDASWGGDSYEQFNTLDCTQNEDCSPVTSNLVSPNGSCGDR